MPQPYASKSNLNEAIQLINAGESAKAETFCREAVESNPGDVNMVALLGATLLKSRQITEAEEFLRKAIDLAPSFAKPHEDLGHLLVEHRRPEEAVAVLQTATRLDPQLEGAHFNLGKALAMLQMIIEHSGEQVIRLLDRVHVADEMQVNIFGGK